MPHTGMPQTNAAVADATADAVVDSEFLLTPPPTATTMRVTKRNGAREAVDLNKIVRAVTRAADGLHAVEPMRVATRTNYGL